MAYLLPSESLCRESLSGLSIFVYLLFFFYLFIIIRAHCKLTSGKANFARVTVSESSVINLTLKPAG